MHTDRNHVSNYECVVCLSRQYLDLGKERIRHVECLAVHRACQPVRPGEACSSYLTPATNGAVYYSCLFAFEPEFRMVLLECQ
jgi:hypothetical protein